MLLFTFIVLDDCSPNPCLNEGNCSDGVNSFTCECAAEFYGGVCQFRKVCKSFILVVLYFAMFYNINQNIHLCPKQITLINNCYTSVLPQNALKRDYNGK